MITRYLKKTALICLLLFGGTGLYAQQITQIEYFFDTDPGYGSGEQVTIDPATTFTDFTFDASVSALSQGLHRLFVRAKDENDRWSEASSRTFYRYVMPTATLADAEEIVEVEYFINTDPGYGLATAVTITTALSIEDFSFDIDLSAVDEGLQNLFVRVKDAAGKWSEASRRTFVKYQIPGTLLDDASPLVYAEYFVNEEPGFGNGIPVEFTATTTVTDLIFEVDLTDLPDGMHSIYLRFQDEAGRWSESVRKTFLRYSISNEELPEASPIIAMEYFINADPGYGNGVEVAFQAVASLEDYQFDVDVSALAVGSTNVVFVRALSEDGRWSEVVRRSFVVCTPADITPDVLENLALEVAFSRQFEVTGLDGTVTWSVAGGALPTGLSLSTAGLLNGTPTALGDCDFTIRAFNGTCEATQSFSISVVCPSIDFESIEFPIGRIEEAYSFQLEQDALEEPVTWSVASGSLPAGLSLNTTSGLISGTPESTGVSTFTLEASSGICSSTSVDLSITVLLKAQELTITDIGPKASVDQPFEVEAIVSTGLSLTYSIQSGPATIQGNVITLNGTTGTVIVQVSQAGNEEYEPISGTVEFTVYDRSVECTGFSVNVQSEVDASCFGVADGSINVSATGGTQPYTFVWAHGPTTSNVSGLAAGTYSVTVRDAFICEQVLEFVIEQPLEITVDAEIRGSNSTLGNGYVHLTVSGGLAPYQYEWNTGIRTAEINNLLGGIYTVVITDANGCDLEESFEVPTIASTTDLSIESIKLYPNPTSGEWKIEVPEHFVGKRAQLYNLSGQSVDVFLLNEKVVHRNNAALPAGIYLLSIEGETVQWKLVKK